MAIGLQGFQEGETVRLPDREVYVHNPNYDEAKIPSYVLEDPLTFVDGRRVTRETWPARRQEILDLFAREMYGAEPPRPETVEAELRDEKVGAACGFAIRRQYRLWFRKDRTGPCIDWIVWIPRYAKKPVPVISFLNYYGNQELVPDGDVPMPESRQGQPANRGIMQNPNHRYQFPLQTILARGYAVMSAYYEDISSDPDPDKDGLGTSQCTKAYDRVFELWGPRDPKRTDNTTALGAWAWGLSRGLDLAERIPEIDAKKAVVTGCSRVGKAALVAAARDERFAVCVPNQTGGGGVPLAKRDYGENISTENRMFTHWYCTAYAKYAKAPHLTMPFDQHLFVACIAPRALLVQGFDAAWFDPKGEWLSVCAASPVWTLFGRGGLSGGLPDSYDTSAIGAYLGYVRRTEAHGLAAVDWMWTMDFADGVFGKR